MGCVSKCNFGITAFVVTILAVVSLSIGVGSDWWVAYKRNNGVYDRSTPRTIFDTVSCERDICVYGKENGTTDGWIRFVQVVCIVCMCSTLVSLLIQTVDLVRHRSFRTMIASTLLTIACALSIVMAMVLMVQYRKQSGAWSRARTRLLLPEEYLLFQTGCMGAILIGGFLCMPAAILLLVFHVGHKHVQ